MSSSNLQASLTDWQANGGVDLYTKSGRALSLEERQEIARRKGICVSCGRRTHRKLRRAAMTDDHVYQGMCIQCQPDSVPAEILEAWKERQQSSPSGSTPPTPARRVVDASPSSLSPAQILSNSGHRRNAAAGSSTGGSQSSLRLPPGPPLSSPHSASPRLPRSVATSARLNTSPRVPSAHSSPRLPTSSPTTRLGASPPAPRVAIPFPPPTKLIPNVLGTPAALLLELHHPTVDMARLLDELTTTSHLSQVLTVDTAPAVLQALPWPASAAVQWRIACDLGVHHADLAERLQEPHYDKETVVALVGIVVATQTCCNLDYVLEHYAQESALVTKWTCQALLQSKDATRVDFDANLLLQALQAHPAATLVQDLGMRLLETQEELPSLLVSHAGTLLQQRSLPQDTGVRILRLVLRLEDSLDEWSPCVPNLMQLLAVESCAQVVFCVLVGLANSEAVAALEEHQATIVRFLQEHKEYSSAGLWMLWKLQSHSGSCITEWDPVLELMHESVLPSSLALELLLMSVSQVDKPSILLKTLEVTMSSVALSEEDVSTLADFSISFVKKFPSQGGVFLQSIGTSQLGKALSKSTEPSSVKFLWSIGSAATHSSFSVSQVGDIVVSHIDKLLTSNVSIDTRRLGLHVAALFVGSGEQKPAAPELLKAIEEIMVREATRHDVNQECIKTSLTVLLSLFKLPNKDPNWHRHADWINRILDRSSSPTWLIEAICEFVAVMVTVSGPGAVPDSIFRSLIRVLARFNKEDCAYESDVLSCTSAALARVARAVSSKLRRLDNDTIDAIIASVYKIIENDDSGMTALAALLVVISEFCAIDCDSMLYAGVIVVVIDTLAERDSCLLIQESGCHILADLASKEDLQIILSIVQTEGVDTLLTTMSMFSGEEMVQLYAARTLSFLCKDTEAKTLVQAQGGLRLLFKALEKFLDKQNAVAPIMMAIAGISESFDEDSTKEVVKHMIPLSIKALCRHSNEERIVISCCRALTNFCRSSSGALELAIADKVEDACLDVLGDCIGNKESTAIIFEFLAVIQGHGAKSTLADVSKPIESIILAMLASFDDALVQKAGCRSLAAYTSQISDEVSVSFLRATIGNVMRAHFRDQDVLDGACQTLSHLTKISGSLILEDVDIEVLVSTMRRFRQSPTIQAHSCQVIRNLIYTNQDTFRRMRGQLVESVEVASQLHPSECSGTATEILAILC